MNTALAFEVMPFRPAPPRRVAPAPAAAPQFVRGFSGPPAECAAALRRAGKTRAQALAIINRQIAIAIQMLRKAAAALKHGQRSKHTSDLFLKIFRVRPGFVPRDFKPSATIRDRGDVVAVRCARVADLLASGQLKIFCAINAANCPDCTGPGGFACSSWGGESKAPRNSHVLCLGPRSWDDMRTGRTASLLDTLMHEPFHIYFGKYVTAHRANPGKFGGIYCISRFVFELNRRGVPPEVMQACAGTPVRRELELAWA